MSNVIRGLDRSPTISELERLLHSPEGKHKVILEPDGSIKAVSASELLAGLDKRVAELEDAETELAEIRATLWLNFGDGDGCHNRCGFVIRHQPRTINMLIEALEKLIVVQEPLVTGNEESLH